MIKFTRILFASLMIAMLITPIFLTQNAYAYTTPTLREYLNTGGDANSASIFGANEVAEQFTSATAHTVAYVQLFLQRSGSPGMVTCQLQTANLGLPTGTVLASGTYNGNNFSSGSYSLYTFYLYDTRGQIYSLLPSTEYALVVVASAGDAANYVLWWQDSAGGLADAIGSDSTDAGVNWVVDAGGADYLFTVYGDDVLYIDTVRAFQGYIEAGDLLFTAMVVNYYPPYYATSDAKDYFQMQVLDTTGTTILAAANFSAWGYRPQSVYMSAAQAASITFGAGYYIRIIGTFLSPPSDTQIMITSDWKSDMLSLDRWIINSAYSIQNYYGYATNTLVQYVTQSGEILTDTGGGIFTNAIAGIAVQRPAIFSFSKSKPQAPGGTPNMVFDSHDYHVILGTPIANDLDTFGNVFGITGQTFAGWAILLLIAVVTIIGLILGGRAAIAVLVVGGLPISLIGAYTGVVGIQWIVVPAIFLFVIFIWKFWWSRT